MRLTLVLASIVSLKVLLLSCTGAVVGHPLVSTNIQPWQYISDKIHSECFDSAAKVVVFSNNWQNESKLLGVSINSTPSYIFGKEASTALQKYQRLHHVYKLESIHVSEKIHPADSVTIFLHKNVGFSRLLKNLHQSIWWNSRAKFLIGLDDLACQLAHEFLIMIWRYNVLSVIYVCQTTESQWIFYTFNPYSYSAPSFWKRFEQDIQRDEKRTFLYHAYDQFSEASPYDNSPFCTNLYFDKLQNVYGYNLKAVYPEKSVGHSEIQIGYQMCSSLDFPIICQVFKAMNATFTVKFTHIKGLSNNSGHPSININEVISGKVDFGLFSIFVRDYWWLQTYPFIYNKLKILTLIQSNYAINFFMLFELSGWLFLSLIVIVSVLSLKYILKVTFLSSGLEFVRIFVSHATLTTPAANFERICFILTIYLWLIINISIQSNFSADKIATNGNKVIDSFDDLLNSNFIVSGFPSYIDMIPSEKLRQRFLGNTDRVCFERLLKKDNIACVIEDIRLKLFKVLEHAPIHVSRDSLVDRGITWLFSEDSPLLLKVNSIMSRFNEAGIINYFTKWDKPQYHEIKRIGLSEFLIASRILIVGWAAALGVAIIEIIVGVIMVCKLYAKYKFNLLTGL